MEKHYYLITNDINQIYLDSQIQEQSQKFEELGKLFEKLFLKKNEFFARAPGRVNLIGEHIDYMGFGILPFALQKECVLASSTNDSQFLRIRHVQSEYKNLDIDLNSFKENSFQNSYLKFVKAGWLAATMFLNRKSIGSLVLPIGMDILLSGDVPVAAGLSSSSSLVVCVALACLYANNLVELVEPFEFLDCIIKEELATGMAGGGMDQTISLLGRNGSALYINFNPLLVQSVTLPKEITFVISNSLVSSPKHETLPFRYNKRVCECAIGCAILCKKLNLPLIVKVKELLEASKLSIPGLLAEAKIALHKEPYSKQEIIDEFNIDNLPKLFSNLKPEFWNQVWEKNTEFFPFQRIQHVLEEAARVEEFVKECSNSQSNIDNLANLMNSSHQSCDTLFDCSCEGLNNLVKICLESGALACRLTGAGWGGCTVSMVRKEDTKEFISKIKKSYFGENYSEEFLFESSPQSGASIILNNK